MMIFLWAFDNLLALTLFSNKVDPKQGLPEALRKITEEQYLDIRARVISFKTSLMFDRSVRLELTANDINTLLRRNYVDYSWRKVKDKVFDRIEFFEIEEGEIILNELLPFLFLNLANICIQKTLNFDLKQGEVIEFQKIKSIFKETSNSMFVPVSSSLASNIVYRVLSLESTNFEKRTSSGSHRISSRKTASPLVSKLKRIQIENDKLVLIS